LHLFHEDRLEIKRTAQRARHGKALRPALDVACGNTLQLARGAVMASA
jgi:hypothetical protein